MEEVIERTKVIECVNGIGRIIDEMPQSPEREAFLGVWLTQAEPILRPALELSELEVGAYRR